MMKKFFITNIFKTLRRRIHNSVLHTKLIPIAEKLFKIRDGINYFLITFRNRFHAENDVIDFKNIPIIINNYNRVTYLRELVECLHSRGYFNIHIIDNHSTYPPLLEFYENCSCHVYRLDRNLGFKAFSLSGIYKDFEDKYFVYTDSDIILPKECPDDILEFFYRLLNKYPFVSKVGCALQINDIPDCYNQKHRVREWEKKFWTKEIAPDVYEARIDTTFALYKPNIPVAVNSIGHNLRVAGKYVAVHKPWYVDSDNLSDEEKYYLKSATTSTFWTSKS